VPTSFAETRSNCAKYAFVKAQLSYCRADGTSLAQQDEKFRKQLSKQDDSLPPSMRKAMEATLASHALPTINTYEHWLLTRFEELEVGRSYGQFGPNPITYNEIAAYAEVCNEDFEPYEFQIIKAIDGATINAYYTERQKESG
jgi:hypothetical protein